MDTADFIDHPTNPADDEGEPTLYTAHELDMYEPAPDLHVYAWPHRFEVRYVDYTAFHAGTRPELFEEEDDDERWISERALSILQRLARERYGVDEVTSGDDGDDPHVTFVWHVDGLESEPTPESIAERIWPTVAAITNETDPGTFGSPYLYTDVERELSDARAIELEGPTGLGVLRCQFTRPDMSGIREGLS